MASNFRGYSPPQSTFDFSCGPSEKKSGSLFSLNNKTFVSKPSDNMRPPATSENRSKTKGSAFVFSGLSGSQSSGLEESMPKLAISAAPRSSKMTPDSGSVSSGSVPYSADVPTPSGRYSADYDASEDDSTDESGNDVASGEDSGAGSSDEDRDLQKHLQLLKRRVDLDELNEVNTAPIFTESVRRHAVSVAGKSRNQPFTQFGLIAGDASSRPSGSPHPDPRIFYNVSAPSSVFICGSQGSGKSHSLSCLLENCLIPSSANKLPRPLTGIVFHFDTFISDNGGSPCEAAWLSSSPDVKVRVLCAPTNVRTIRHLYRRFRNVTVEELRLSEADLNTKRMLDLMAVTAGNMPLYLHVVNRILRDLRIFQQQTGKGFDYSLFKKMVSAETLTKDQLAPLKQRLDTLESFMVESQAKAFDMFASERSQYAQKLPKAPAVKGTNWTPKVCYLTRSNLFQKIRGLFADVIDRLDN